MAQLRLHPKILAIALALPIVSVSAQTPLDFEVASIRPHPRGDSVSNTNISRSRFTATNVSVGKMLRNAFDVENDQLDNVPRWADSVTYDIEATIANGVAITRDDIPQLILSLLQKRFSLRYHRETKELTQYELEVAKNGPKLTPQTGEGGSSTSTNSNNGVIVMKARKISMGDLAYSLRRQLGRPVTDKTGLTGEYDLDLAWSTEQAADNTQPSLFTALQQFGLKLASTKGPAEIIVIDEIEKPSEN